MPQKYPLPAYHFMVQIASFPNDVAFSSVEGLSFEFFEAPDDIKKTTSNNPNKLMLKRALSSTMSELSQWMLDSLKLAKRKSIDIQVMLLNEQHEPVATWHIANATPIKYSISPFNAMANMYVEEMMEFEFSFFKRAK